MLEAEVEAAIRVEAAKHGCILMRNNSGALKDENGRLVRYGLGNESPRKAKVFKSSDEIGITTITITADMVGKRIGVFTAIEVKAPGWNPKRYNEREQAQANFLEWVRSVGGIAGFANSVDAFLRIVVGYVSK